jgi:hypothetical protein
MKSISKTKVFAAVIAMLAGVSVQAAVVFSNSANNLGGDCSFSTTCAAVVGQGNDFAAQQFSLTSATILSSASFTNYVNYGSTQPNSVNWMFIESNSATDLPGTVIASGSGAISSRQSVGTNFGYDLVQESFGLPNIELGAGSYYFAFQAISSEFETYLASGSLELGAAETFNGGATWQRNYEGFSSVASSLSGDPAVVPEPTTVALLGLGLLGVAVSRRKSAKNKNV